MMKTALRITAAAALAALGGTAFAQAKLDANAEFDTSYQNDLKPAPNTKVKRGIAEVGRIEINISGKAEGNGGFVAAKGTVLAQMANHDGGIAGVDDAWVQAGTAAVDLKLGRFEAADLYPTPGDALRVGGFYQTNALRGRAFNGLSGGGADDRLHWAITANFGAGTSLEVGIVEKKDLSQGTGDSFKGIRPVLSFAAGPVTGRVGFETGKTLDAAAGPTETASFTGFGGTIAAGVGGGVTVRANVASAKAKYAAGDVKRNAFLIGVDVDALTLSAETGKRTDPAGSTKRTGVFGAYGIPLFAKGATLSPSLGWEHINDHGYSYNDTRVGFRIHYDF